MSKMGRSIAELTEKELKALIAAGVTKGIFEAQSRIERTKDPDRETVRMAILEVDDAVSKIADFVDTNNPSSVVELSDIKALIEIEIRKLSSAALEYLAGDQFVELVGGALKLKPKEDVIASEDRRPTAVRLCRSFAQSLAYYRAQWAPEFEDLFKREASGPAANFWRAVNGLLFDSCVLDWCKLFGDQKAHFHWSRIVGDPLAFEAELLARLGLDRAGFNQEIEAMRKYRDKWVAHQDLERTGTFPVFDVPKKAIWFYYAQVANEIKRADPTSDLASLPADLQPEYQETEEDAKAVYRRFIRSWA